MIFAWLPVFTTAACCDDLVESLVNSLAYEAIKSGANGFSINGGGLLCLDAWESRSEQRAK